MVAQMRLRQLSPSDLQLLLFYMFSFDPSAFLPHLPAGSAPDGLAGITREYLVGARFCSLPQATVESGPCTAVAGPDQGQSLWPPALCCALL